MATKKLRGLLVLGCALLGSCLGGGGVEEGGGGSTSACTSLSGGASHVTKNDNAGGGCVGCAVTNEQAAADGDLGTSADVSAPNSFSGQGPIIRATAQTGIVYAGGQTAAVLFMPPASGGFNPAAQSVTLTTFLGGNKQEDGASYIDGTGPDGLTFKGFVTSRPFDAVEVMVSNTQAAAGPWQIAEICSDGAPQ